MDRRVIRVHESSGVFTENQNKRGALLHRGLCIVYYEREVLNARGDIWMAREHEEGDKCIPGHCWDVSLRYLVWRDYSSSGLVFFFVIFL